MNKVLKAPKCKAHNVCYCHCQWGNPGVAMDAAPRMTLSTVAMDAATFADNALTEDEKSLIEMAIRSVQRPARRAAPVASDAYGTVAATEDINQLYARLKEQKRNEPVYVYEGN
jgi:hypothetical protein